MYRRRRSGPSQVRGGGGLARTSAAAETSAGHLHWLTEVMRVSGPERTHPLPSGRGFLLPGGLLRGPAGAAVLLISFANKLKLLFFFFFLAYLPGEELWVCILKAMKTESSPQCVLKLGRFFNAMSPTFKLTVGGLGWGEPKAPKVPEEPELLNPLELNPRHRPVRVLLLQPDEHKVEIVSS